MAANTTHVVVVEIDGLWFRIQKLRGRRAFRGARALQVLLGSKGYLLISSPGFWEPDVQNPTAEELLAAQLNALVSLETTAAASYAEAEGATVELLAYSAKCRGQGVCYRDTEPDTENPGKGWIPLRTMETLDTFGQVDHMTWQALRWEMIKLGYRPTSAAAGTNAGTPVAATTSTQASSPSGAAPRPATGTPKVGTQVAGISGG